MKTTHFHSLFLQVPGRQHIAQILESQTRRIAESVESKS